MHRGIAILMTGCFSTGEEFAIQENKLLCKQHYDELVEGDSGEGSSFFVISHLSEWRECMCECV